MTTKPLKKGATYDDLARVPEHYVAEMFDGELYASPRPALPHAHAAVALVVKLGGPFGFDGDPGGWLWTAAASSASTRAKAYRTSGSSIRSAN